MTALEFTQTSGNLQNDLKTARIIDRPHR